MFNRNKDLYGDNLYKLTEVDGRLTLLNEPIHVSDGYYLIPGFSRYYINKNVVVYDRISGKEMTYRESGSNYPYFSLQKDGSNRQMTFDAHVILALAFLPVPKGLSRVEVNHIDNNRRNCTLGNLEWVSRSDNVFHRKNMLQTDSGFVEKRRYRFIISGGGRNHYGTSDINLLSELIGLSKTKIYKHLADNRDTKVFEHDGYIVEFEMKDIGSEERKIVYVHDLIAEKVHEMPTLTSAARGTSVLRSTVSDMIYNSVYPNQKIIKGYRYYDNPGLIPHGKTLSDGELIYQKYCRYNSVPHNSCGYIVYDVNSGVGYPYHSLRDMPSRFRSKKMTYPTLGDMSRLYLENNGFMVIPIYSNNHTSELSDNYSRFIKERDVKYILNVPEYFD